MSVQILNYIRQTSTSAYQDLIPLATATNITEVGAAVLDAPSTIQNEFLSALINKVGLQLFNDRTFTNPLTALKKGRIEYGQTIEDIFIEMAEAKAYITGTRDGETPPDQYEVNKAIAHTGFYYKIYGKQYFKTIHRNDLKRAFTSPDGLTRLVASIMTSMSNAQNLDDYRMTIALIARQIETCSKEAGTKWRGKVKLLTEFEAAYGKTLTPVEAFKDIEFLKFFANQIQKYAQRLSTPRSDFNPAGVVNWSPKNEQRLMMLEDIQSDLNTNILAWADNPSKLDIGAVDLINAWYSIGNDATGTLRPEHIEVKGELGVDFPCVAVLYHPNMVKVYTKEAVSTTSENARGLYYNIFNTFEDMYACSPFENFVAFFLE